MRQKTLQKIIDAGAIAVIRMNDSTRLIPAARALRKGGVTVLEITMTTPDALGLIERTVNEFENDEEVIVGVGSVMDGETAHRAIEAGADFVVSPIFERSVVEEAHRNDVPVMPGAMTPTEIQTAVMAGADVVKVFPSSVLGMEFFRAVLAPMPDLRLMPTGGVDLTNAGDWLRAGACAVGVGSALLDREAIAAGDYERLTANARKLMQNIQSARAAM